MAPSAQQLILKFLLGASGEALSVRDVLAACALFGVRENSVRVALVRLAAAGMVVAAGRGSYRLGPMACDLAEDVGRWRQAEARVQPWSGQWLAVYCAGLGRSNRKALAARERVLDLLGFRALEPELYVRPDNLAGGVQAVRERLYKLGLEASAPVFVISDLEPARDARGRQLWDGESLTRAYRQTRAQLQAWLASEPELEREVAARESFLIGSAAIRQLVFDPWLPDPLVDSHARREFVESVLEYDSRGQAIWRELRIIPLSSPVTGDTSRKPAATEPAHDATSPTASRH